MKSKFSKTWKSSVQPRKQRKYVHNAPKHTKSTMLSANLSKELRTKYGTRSIRIRKGDKVKVLRGNFKGKDGKVEEVDTKKTRIYIEKIGRSKKDGSKTRVPINITNVQIVELDLDDKKRKKKVTSFKKTTGDK